MAYKFNPFTGTLDYFEISAGSNLTIQTVLRSILIERNDIPLQDFPLMSILFDDDSILFNDDEAI